MDFDDFLHCIYAVFIASFIGVIVLLGLLLAYSSFKEIPLSLALEQEHICYHQKHENSFNAYCSRCGRADYSKNDTNITLSESDNATTN